MLNAAVSPDSLKQAEDVCVYTQAVRYLIKVSRVVKAFIKGEKQWLIFVTASWGTRVSVSVWESELMFYLKVNA